jgi:hypothetical protein
MGHIEFNSCADVNDITHIVNQAARSQPSARSVPSAAAWEPGAGLFSIEQSWSGDTTRGSDTGTDMLKCCTCQIHNPLFPCLVNRPWSSSPSTKLWIWFDIKMLCLRFGATGGSTSLQPCSVSLCSCVRFVPHCNSDAENAKAL